MKRQSYQGSKLKHQLMQYELNGKKELFWKLKYPDQVEFVRSLGYDVEEYLFYVHTRKLPEHLRTKYKWLNQIHLNKCKGKQYLAITLTPSQKELLKAIGVDFNVLKYKIRLQRQKRTRYA